MGGRRAASAWNLVKGHFWRAVGVIIVAGIITGIVGGIIGWFDGSVWDPSEYSHRSEQPHHRTVHRPSVSVLLYLVPCVRGARR